MKSKRIVFIPAVVIALAAIALTVYSLYIMTIGHHPKPTVGGFRPPRRNENASELFKTMGTIALMCGAASFSWLYFKKKLKSPLTPVKKLGKLVYSVHTYTGWIALVLVAAHGGYFLVTKLRDGKVYSGLAALLILCAMAVYGWLLKRTRSKQMRKTHFLLSCLWLPILLLHAGGSFLLTAAGTLGLWVFIWNAERAVKHRQGVETT